jgi:uncharacterized surface protein with fasciclin (FAS1) repeats
MYKIFKMKLVSKLALFGLATLLTMGGCQKDWDAHNGITDDRLNKDLLTRLNESTNLTKFAELIVKTGYDTVLSSSRTFTVFAPTNDALAGLDPAIANDLAKLKPFIANHIAYQSYVTTKITDTARIEMLNGKFQNMLGKKIASSGISEADQLAKNGILQVVDKMLPVLPNCWEAMNASVDFPTAQAAFLNKLNYVGFDPDEAEVIGIDPNTGAPIYKPGTGNVPSNLYWDKVYDLRIEQKQYTYFAIENTGFTAEVAKFNPYFRTGVQVVSDSLASFQVLKDFAFEGKYLLAQLPDTMVSKFGVKVGIDRSKITKTIDCSNGVIYVMSSLPVTPSNKFISRIIQAENYLSTSHDRRSNTFFRDRVNPVTGLAYRDLLVSGHGVAMFNLRYALSDMPTMKYRAYWVAVNDFQTATFSQRLLIDSTTSSATAPLPYVVVPVRTFTEVLIGEFTLSTFKPSLNIYLMAANSGTAAVNPITCDYIRIEPVN